MMKELQAKADIYQRFVEECTRAENGAWTEVRKLYQGFTSWAKDSGLRSTGSRDVFETNMTDILGPPERGGEGLGYKLALDVPEARKSS